jgi:hypothetical protein
MELAVISLALPWYDVFVRMLPLGNYRALALRLLAARFPQRCFGQADFAVAINLGV